MPMIVVYVLLRVVLCVAVGWLLYLPQVLPWRLVFGLIQFGGLWNLVGLIWLGYDNVWPGEPVITAGFVLVVLGLLFFKKPLVTHREHATQGGGTL